MPANFMLSKILHIFGFLAFLCVDFVSAQSCANYGSPSSSGCLCPPGFGGSNCSQPACGGTIFDGSSRSLVPASGGFPNLTAAGCSCSSGWTGTGCNVCTTSSACQSAFTSVNGNVSPSGVGLGVAATNNTVICNTQPTVYTSGELSCQLNVRTLCFLK